MTKSILGEYMPTVNVAINKSRIKSYTDGPMPSYYLKNGTEFQIELFNPTANTVLAEITLNNKIISQGGIVLKPGQRLFLERYLDVSKKFLFETYEVENSSAAKEAIKNNGDLKVRFFQEKINHNLYRPILLGGSFGGPSYPYQGDYYFGATNNCYNSSLTNTGGVATTTLGLNNNITNSIADGSTTAGSSAFYSSTLDGLGWDGTVTCSNTTSNTYDSNLSFTKSASPDNSKILRTAGLSKTIETGRVEKGSHSSQKFDTVNMDFETYAFHTVEYKLLPISQKKVQSEEILVKSYCTNCGAKQKNGFKFCPVCGNKN